MENAIRDNIVDDLLTKRPVGPGKVTVVHEEDEYYHYEYNMYKTRIVSSNVDHFGYEPKAIFDLNLHTEYDVEEYLRKRFYDGDYGLTRGRKIGLSRKKNRLWERVKHAVKEVKKDGANGIYLVHKRYGGSYGHLHADSVKAAQAMARIFYGFLLPDGSEDLRVEYLKDGTVEDMKMLNAELIEDFNRRVKSLKSDIESKQKRIANIESIVSVVGTVEAGQVNASKH